MFYKFRSLDWQILISPLLLAIVGLISLYTLINIDSLAETYVKKQILFLVVGCLLYVFMSLYRLDFDKLALPLYFISLAILITVLIQGQVISGATIWLKVFTVRIEPVEWIKFFLLIATASLVNKYGSLRKRHSLLAAAVTFIIPAILIMIGKEFGTVVIVFIGWFFILAIYNFNYKFFLIFLVIFSLIGSLIWFKVLTDDQKSRLINFSSSDKDIKNKDYQAEQAKIAIGSGGLTGIRQMEEKNMLPEAHNDFIFALIGRTWGFLGIAFLLAIMFGMYFRIIWVLYKMKFTTFQNLTIIGIWSVLFSQSFINIGMNLGVLPITGITLPFVSYGGSSMLSSFMALSIIQNFICQNKEKARVV